ncbi:MAG TPA: GNAT family N-acetyltransferase [Sphingomicrobium sp.]|nr:GNAT family N-acetyltransferase [Sphingomicrobium sp.]
MTYEAVPDGELAAVVTYLEMRSLPEQHQYWSPLSLHRVEAPEPDHYRHLFRLVGAPWLWFSRLTIDDSHLAAIIQHPKVELYSVRDENDHEVGIVELDLREPHECELAFIGLVPELAGKGHGKWLLAEAVRLAWREGVDRVHVHTCSLDHPSALSAYRRAGFTPYRRAIERFPDPRLLGVLPKDCAPQVPLLGTEAPVTLPERWA